MNHSNKREPLVVVQHVQKKFGKNTAVSDVSFEVYGGEVFGLLGPNGAGKTTTIRLLLDIFKPDAGQVSVLGGPMTPQRADRIGYMPEERGLYPDMRVLDCLVYLGTLKGLGRKEARESARRYLVRLGLGDQERTKISALSRGMTQKVQVIAAVLHSPDLLIIDEPFANLDPINSELVRQIILELRQQGKAIIMTSHLMALVESLCDRIALIHQGTVVLAGTVAEVRRKFARNVLRLTGTGVLDTAVDGVTQIVRHTASDWEIFIEADTEPRAVLARLLAEHDDRFLVDRFEIAMPSLNEIFVQVVQQPEVT